ncbi:MAG TPA: helix-turn-helix transcriptional regulator [Streptosporangiaceae bacterium]|jgi:transcriptional regulator with XRE-family HTH domain
MESEGLGPAVQRAILIQELRRLRSIKGETQEQVARARGWSVSKFIRIENGVAHVTKSDLEGLLRHYGEKDQRRVDELIDLAKGARRPNWWDGVYDGGDKAFEAYLGYEDGAATIRVSQLAVVPGVLQIESYMRLALQAYGAPEDQIETSINLRLKRQERMLKRAPGQTYLLDEAILDRPVGDVMAGQLRHLLQVADRPEVEIRIVPKSAGLHFGLLGPFVLLGFGSLLEDVVYIEGRKADLLIAERGAVGADAGSIGYPDDEVAGYQDGFERLRTIALGPQDSLDRIDQAIRDMC